MADLMDIRLHHQIAHEIYRQQMLQRLPDPFPAMLPVPPPPHRAMQLGPPPPQHRYGLPGASAKLQNAELWSQFHQIGTEMIITKSGRRMFPSLRIALAGLEDDANYCVLLEMVPRGDCRYKFSGSQWVPAGGAEPQSTQRMYLHPDSPALGSHWTAQPVLFNKVKLTNNTLDSCGHIVLTSMHKYQPRLHIIRTSDPAQIPWAPQQAYLFAETDFVAVTAYQNDRITKLKIDNNPFAKGFRESGQSRCKRKLVHSSSGSAHHAGSGDDDLYDDAGGETMKRKRSNSCGASVSSLDDSGLSGSDDHSSGTSSPANTDDIQVCDEEDETRARSDSFLQSQHNAMSSRMQHMQHNPNYPHLLAAHHHHGGALVPNHHHPHDASTIMHFRDSMHQHSLMNLAFSYFNQRNPYQQLYPNHHQFHDIRSHAFQAPPNNGPNTISDHPQPSSGLPVTAASLHSPTSSVQSARSDTQSPQLPIRPDEMMSTSAPPLAASSPQKPVAKKCGFSISAILGDR